MQNRLLARTAAIIGLISYVGMGARTASLLGAIREKRAPADEPYVQVTSVNTEPSIIHRDSKPDRATIFVQIMLQGTAPPGSTVSVDIGTYSSDPAENEISYPKQSQTVPLKEGLTVVEFSAEANSRTLSGKVKIAAEIRKVNRGVSIKAPDSYKDWQAELKTVVP